MIEQVEMLDGRVYSTIDGWRTVLKRWPDWKKPVKVKGEEADLARFLAMMQQAGGT